MEFLKWLGNKFKHPDETYIVKLDIKDPWFTQKYITSQSITKMADSIRENKRDTYNIISFYFMMFLTLSLGIFFPKNSIIGIFVLGIMLMLILLPRVIAFYKRRIQLAEQHAEILRSAKEMELLRKRE